ncbi:Proton-translocating NADH-quinone oxidoreductase, chain M [Gammaproteobacteria bacterium]
MNEVAWSAQLPYPILGILQFFPFVGGLFIFWFREWKHITVLVRIFSGVELLLAIFLYQNINQSIADFQFVEHASFLHYHAAVDGMSVLFILLAAFIIFMMSWYGSVRRLHSSGVLSTLILSSEAPIMVMLTTLNLVWFVGASLVELTLVSLFIGRWSTADEEDRALAMTRFLQFQGLGIGMLISGISVLAWNHADLSGQWSFDLFDLVQTPPIGKFQSVAFFLFFYGLALRTPLFPLHGWLPHVVHRGSVAIAPVLLLGTKVGIYAMVRFLLPLTPHAALAWRPYVVGTAMMGVFYAAILAILQNNLRRLLSFAVISHTGLIIVGLFTLRKAGIEGALLLSVTTGLAATGMLFMVGFVFRRARSTDLNRLGGLFDRIPFLAITFLISGLSIIGMPGTPGFDAAHLVLDAVIDQFGAFPAVATALGNVVAAGFLLWAFQRAFLAPAPEGYLTAVERTLPMEYWISAAIVVVLLSAGFYVEPWIDLIDATVQTMTVFLGQE